ncbi:2-polyprenyl-6-methoxyphenol hydroxylase-like FAD-dependent oxidoreductase [Streptomyces sp. LBL]|uniref:FAD-dependent oxidoreductase n=1 Tax=Streptomyces sp. LBL TaxID=2940562 RepID=UPI00247634E8|nr:NAD(P)/FAD-dependent oxidoreductase [Streptomyces sp. LBL]MDH6622490.1 2-polyprenyl-6-methoxyphenol hydroxylase-like FAD-dependent oxidoreductase [Streptomyces sp. LBL]
MARILVIGGGIAGTATAVALRKAGIEVAVYEAHPDSAEDIGAFLTLASNGMRALAQLDASAAVTAVGFPLVSMRVVDHAGAELAHVPLGEADDPQLQYRCLRRGELNAALQAEAARRGIGIVHGARLSSVEDGPDGVTAHFADGSTAAGDLLVGADGLSSTVRRAISPATQPRYTGQRVFYGYTRAASVSGPDACITMVRGRTVPFGCAVSPGGEAHWFARVPGVPLSAAELAQGSAAGRRDLLVPLLREDAPVAADVVASTTDDILVTNATEIPPGSPWRASRTLLIGDAAHAASPATGQGASMALEDAVVLAKSLRDAPDTETALSCYESLRRPRTEHNTTVSGNISRGTHTPSRPAGGAPPSRPGDDDLSRILEWDSDIVATRQAQER